MKLAGLDIGTTTICGTLLDAGTGEILSVRTEENAFRLPGGAPWERAQDPNAICAAAARMLEGFRAGNGGIDAIGVTGQMHGILYVDGAGRAISPLYTWQDGRGDQEMSAGKSFASFLSDSLPRPVSTGMGFVTHFYNLRKGLVPSNAAALCTIGDYVAMSLAQASRPLMDATNAASLGCFDLAALSFAQEAMRAPGVEAALFPQVSTTYPSLGETPQGTPVFPAIGDNQASFLGSVCEVAGTVLANVGTSSQISLFSADLHEVPGVDTRPFPLAGYLLVGAGLCGGSAYALLRDFFEQTVRMFTGNAGAVSWEIMNDASEEALSRSARLVVDTRFAGMRGAPDVRGSIANIGMDNFAPGNLIAGFREGIVDELIGFFNLMPEAPRRGVKRLVGSGNAIRRNPPLRKAFERKLKMPMRMPAHREEASFGAALLAGMAAKILPDLGAAGALVHAL